MGDEPLLPPPWPLVTVCKWLRLRCSIRSRGLAELVALPVLSLSDPMAGELARREATVNQKVFVNEPARQRFDRATLRTEFCRPVDRSVGSVSEIHVAREHCGVRIG